MFNSNGYGLTQMQFSTVSKYNDNSLLCNIVFIVIVILIITYLIYTRNVDK